MLLDVCTSIICNVVISESHDDHVSTLFQRHLLVLAIPVPGSIGKVAANIVHRILVGIQSTLLNLKVRLQEKRQQLGVGVQEDGVRGEDHVHSIHVAIGGDLLQEQVLIPRSTTQLNSAKRLANGERRNGQIVLASGFQRISSDALVEVRTDTLRFLIVMVEEVELYN